MKRFLIIMLIPLITVMAIGSMSINTKQFEGNRFSSSSVQRISVQVSSVTADATDPNFAQKMWSDTSVFVPIPVEWANVALSFYGYGDGDGDGDPNDSTFSYDVYLCDLYGGWECVSSANTGTIGAMKLSHNPATGEALTDPNESYRWADDLNEGTVKTTSTIAYSDYQSNDGCAKTKFDRHSAYGIYVRIYDMTDQSVTSITCVMNGFNQ